MQVKNHKSLFAFFTGVLSFLFAILVARASQYAGADPIIEHYFPTWDDNTIDIKNSYLPAVLANWSSCQEKPSDEPQNDLHTGARGPILPDMTCLGSFSDTNDKSDYYFLVLSMESSINLWLTNVPYGADYNVALRDANLALVPDGFSGNPGNAPEYIDTDTLPTGRYYVQVHNYGLTNLTEPYELRAGYFLPFTPTPTVTPNPTPSSTPIPTITHTPTATATPTATPSVLFHDDFENGTNQWEIDGIGWQLRQDLTGNRHFCVHATGDYQYAQAGSAAWRNYAFEADVMVTNDSEIGSGNLLFRISDEFYPLYVFSFYPEGSDLGKEKPKYQLLDTIPVGLDRGTWHRVRIEAVGASIKVFVEGIQGPILSVVDPNPINRGSIAIGAGLDEFPADEIDVCFDNVRVISIP